jgi:hypothetical protein
MLAAAFALPLLIAAFALPLLIAAAEVAWWAAEARLPDGQGGYEGRSTVALDGGYGAERGADRAGAPDGHGRPSVAPGLVADVGNALRYDAVAGTVAEPPLDHLPAQPAPAPAPAPAPEPAPAVYQPQTEIERLLCSKPWDCAAIVRIARCESNFRPDAVGAGSYGLLQIQASVWAGFFPRFWETWMIAAVNIEMAWVIYQRAGHSFRPWSCW